MNVLRSNHLRSLFGGLLIKSKKAALTGLLEYLVAGRRKALGFRKQGVTVEKGREMGA
jgi:hypothetical protein